MKEKMGQIQDLEAVLEEGPAADRTPALESKGLHAGLSHHSVMSPIMFTALILFPHMKRY